MDNISKYQENEEYYENLDKRTKAFKDYTAWKKNHEASPKGLGDSVQQVTKATGIEKAVKFLAGEDCGCDRRRDSLNKIFRYRQPKCFTEEEYTYLAELFSSSSNKVSGNRLIKIYNRVFTANKTPTQCSPCIKKVYDELKLYFDKYDG